MRVAVLAAAEAACNTQPHVSAEFDLQICVHYTLGVGVAIPALLAQLEAIVARVEACIG